MLFDLRGRGRRRAVQAIYLGLAVLMGGGLVFFGIGGGTNGGLFDAINGNGSSSSGNQVFEKRVKAADKTVLVNPKDAAAWYTLAKAHLQLSGVGDNFDANTSAYTASGKKELRLAARAWTKYVALRKSPDPNLATLMVNGYIGLGDAKSATAAQQIVVEAQSNSGQYSRLAQLAYAAGLTRLGDLSAGKAVDLAPKDEKANVKDALAQAKTQSAAAVSGGQTTTTG